MLGIGNDVVSDDQLVFGTLRQLSHGFRIAFLVDLNGQRFDGRFHSGFVGLVGLFEFAEKLLTPLGEFLHLGVFVRAQDLAVLDGVLVVAAQIVE